jgi:hypothetical protein
MGCDSLHKNLMINPINVKICILTVIFILNIQQLKFKTIEQVDQDFTKRWRQKLNLI